MQREARDWGRLVVGLVWVVSLTSPAPGLAQSSSVTPDQEYLQLIKVNQDIAPLGANPFGENISPYNGELSFDETDVSLKGNGPDMVVARSLSTTSPLSYAYDAERPFGDWDLNIPRIETVVVAKIQGGYTGWITSGLSTTNRCTNFTPPPTSAAIQGGSPFSANQFWYGYHLIVPGYGSQDLMLRNSNNSLAPAAGTSTYGIVTKQNWMISCTASTAADDGGQGFIALAPDGTQYTFTHLVYRPMTTLTEPLGTTPETVSAVAGSVASPAVATSSLVERNDAFMYVTQVVDRFGNSLTYSYNNANGNLTSITASDGRSITITYDSTGYMITSITANASNVPSRTWTYAYNTSNAVIPSLSSVTLPDGSAWTYNLSAFQLIDTQTEGGDCTNNGIATLDSTGTTTGTITHPSGLTGTFSLQPMMHGRSYVPKSCWGPVSAEPDLQYYDYPEYYFQPTIVSKTFTGAGLQTETWSYSYSSANQSYSGDACYSAGTCASTVSTDVVDPNGNDVHYIYSNRFDATEGQLLSTTYYAGAAGGTVMRTQTNTYANPTGGPWPTQYGTDLQTRNNWYQTEELAPLQERQTTEEGDTYTWQAMAYDGYADPTQVQRYNSISGQQSIEETTTFLNDPNLWVLGLTQTVVNNTTGETEIANTYNSSDLLQQRSRFGEFIMSYTYNSAGQLASFTDGDNHTTSISNYYRGIPQSISYPDNTSESLTVDDLGQITSITDQAGYTTQYSYDPIGRVAQITYPTNDPNGVSWYSKTFSYSFVTSAERGVPADHWDRIATVGSDVTTTYFDADLRPVVTDSSDGSATYTTLSTYDYTGATTYTSYPASGSPAFGTASPGTYHIYDALERETQTQQDSELGSLTTTTQYQEGAALAVTDPKGNLTTTNYQVFDEPAYKDAVEVQAPAGITQTITRDIYGNPTAINQSGLYGTESDSVTKTLTYDSYHRLCATSEPESGSTLMSYDGANNLAWSAQGQPLGASCSTTAPSNAIARSYDPMNRVLTIAPPPGTQTTSYQYDARGNVSNVVSGIATNTFNYDSLNHLTTQTLTVPGYAWGIGYSYDSYGHVNAIGYPSYNGSSEGIALSPDGFGRATQVGGYASGITYFPNNQVESFNYGNGASYVSQQNTRQLLSNYSYGVGSTLNLSEDVTYDQDANITNVTDLVNGQRTKAFGYDALNRLTSATANGLYGVESYSYDALNNLRTRLTGGDTLTLGYANNQLATVSENGSVVTTYGYDAQGNRNNLTSGGASTAYSFDVENQLLSVSGVESYAYDAAGRRVAKTATNGAVSAYYFYDQGGQLMYAFDPSTATATNYIYLGTKLIARHASLELALPGSLTASANPNDGNFTMSWGAVSGATSYNLQESVNGGAWNTIYSGASTDAALSGRAGGSYTYLVQACASGTCTGWTSSGTVGVWPAIPTITVPSGTINGSYTVSWSASTSATGYTVQEALNGGAWTTIATNQTGTSIARPGTTTGSYTYQVQASNSYGTAGWSATSAAVTVNTSFGVVPSPTPTLSVPATNNTGSATISWSAASPVTGYTLQQSSNGGSSWITVYSGTGTSVALSGLAAGTYTYQLQACNTAGGGEACTAWIAGGPMVLTLPPTGTPSLSTPSASSNGSYTVSWSAVSTATSYTLQQQISSGSWTTVQSSSATSWPASGEGDDTYGYRVQGCNAGGCGPWSGTGTTTVTLPPSSAPSLSGGGSSSTGSYTVSWGSVATATSYNLQENVNSGGWSTVQSSSATSWSASGLGDGTYQYQVQACNVGGCGPWSSAVTMTVLLPPSTAPSLSGGGTSNTGSYSVSWSSVATATSYTLQENANGAGWATVQSSSATSWSASGRGNGTYEYQAQACNASGCSGWSSAITETVALIPVMPTSPFTITQTGSVGKMTVHLSWSAIANASSYTLQMMEGTSGAWTTQAGVSGTTWSDLILYSGEVEFRLEACNSVGCSAWSTPQTVELDN
jgi:YD repeat-containing protein